MPSLSNIPGFTELSTSPDAHAAWPAEAGSYNAPGDGTTPLVNPQGPDGEDTGKCQTNFIYVGRGNNSGNVKGDNKIVCYGVWTGGEPKYWGGQTRTWINHADRMLVFSVNTSTGAITKVLDNENTDNNFYAYQQVKGYDNPGQIMWYTTPGTGIVTSHGYSRLDTAGSIYTTIDAEDKYKCQRLNTAGNGFLVNNSQVTNSRISGSSWRISHCPKTASSTYGNAFIYGEYNPYSSWPYNGRIWSSYFNKSSNSCQYANTVSGQSNGSMAYDSAAFASQPDAGNAVQGDMAGQAIRGNTSYGFTIANGGAHGSGGSDANYWNITTAEYYANNVSDIYGLNRGVMFQRSGSTYGVWRTEDYAKDTRLLTNTSTKIYDVAKKSWTIPKAFIENVNVNSVAGICNDQWFGGLWSDSSPLYYFNNNTESLPCIKWEIDDTTGVKIVGSVMPPTYAIENSLFKGETWQTKARHVFPIWTNSSDANPSWVVVVYWTGGGNYMTRGAAGTIAGETTPVLKCYPWPTFTSQNIAVGS